MNSKLEIRQPSINQESTIKSIENPSIITKNNKQKYNAVEDTFR